VQQPYRRTGEYASETIDSVAVIFEHEQHHCVRPAQALVNGVQVPWAR
jgi:hypothetical protein